MRLVLLCLIGGAVCANPLRECRSLYVEPMPESMDSYIAAELVKWGKIAVVADPEKADCVASFGAERARIDIKSSESDGGKISASLSDQRQLPRTAGTLGTGRNGALQIAHRESSRVVWAASKSDTWSMRPGVGTVARKLVGQIRKDWGKKPW